MKRSDLYVRIYEAVRDIPPGKVATYGQIARMAGIGGQPRLVGYALHALTEEHDVPWHRIINARGRISARGDSEWEIHQRALLESEGVVFRTNGSVDLARFGFDDFEYERGE